MRKALAVPGHPTTKATQPPPTALDDSVPVRQAKPWLAYLEGGFPRYGSAGLMYNFNPYFALGAQAGALTGSFTINAYLGVTPRVYFNPHELAGFAEVLTHVNFPSNPALWLTPRLGLEWRPKSPGGTTLSLAAGIPLLGDSGYQGNYGGVGFYYRPSVDVSVAIGWAF